MELAFPCPCRVSRMSLDGFGCRNYRTRAHPEGVLFRLISAVITPEWGVGSFFLILRCLPRFLMKASVVGEFYWWADGP